MLKTILSVIPEQIRKPFRATKQSVLSLPYRGKGRLCTVCGKTSKDFIRGGVVPRKGASCLHCGALERHRFVWHYFNACTDLFDGRPKRVLHVAAEACFEPRLRERLGNGYLTADLFDPRAMVQIDITNIPYPDASFAAIYCAHVLEHVHDDRQALREFYRVLEPGGWAIITVPIVAAKTFEDSSVVEPAQRIKEFGQEDHVRRYGPDFADRLAKAGFEVKTVHVTDLLNPDMAAYFGITSASGEIFHCIKPGKAYASSDKA